MIYLHSECITKIRSVVFTVTTSVTIFASSQVNISKRFELEMTGAEYGASSTSFHSQIMIGCESSPFILHSMPYLLHLITLKLLVICVGSKCLRPITVQQSVLKFATESMHGLQNVMNSMVLYVQRMATGYILEACSFVFSEWRKLTVRRRKRRLSSAESDLYQLLRAFCDWRVFTTCQLHLSLCASTIASQVIVITGSA